MSDVHWWVTVDYQQIVDSYIANQIHRFAKDYGKFILNVFRKIQLVVYYQSCILIGWATSRLHVFVIAH